MVNFTDTLWSAATLFGITISLYARPGSAFHRHSEFEPNYPKFLPGSRLYNGTPWGNFDPGSNGSPDTGAVRKYDFTITRTVIRPDTVPRNVTLINGQYPGPLVEANWGDTIEVTVHNKIVSEGKEGTSIHWHGIRQNGTPYEDGVPGVSQCPIAPGQSFTYSFRADQYGTTWYHSHYSMQYTDGVVGPIAIYGPSHEPYDIDLGHVLVNDWMYTSYYQQVELAFEVPPIFVPVDNNLLNGRGKIPCNQTQTGNHTCDPYALIPKFKLRYGKTHRIRLANIGDGGNQHFQLDDHELTVIANDLVPIVPYKTNVVTVGVGQRTDVLVTANVDPSRSKAYWMRSDLDLACLHINATNPTALAAVYYDHANTSTYPNTTGVPWQSNDCRNDPLELTVPQYPMTPPNPAATTQTIEVTVFQNASGVILFAFNGTSFKSDFNSPLLLMADKGNNSYAPTSNVYNIGSNSSIRMIFYNPTQLMHPLHLHGHNFWVLAEGNGTWNGSMTNPSNPQRRDVQIVPGGSTTNPSYLVFEWMQDNPGVWPFHCHTSLHASGGFFLNFLEQPNNITQDMQIPPKIAETCTNWQAYTNSGGPVNEIDSGV